MIIANCILVGVVKLASWFVIGVLASEESVLASEESVGSIYFIIGKLQSNNEATIVRTQYCYTIPSYYKIIYLNSVFILLCNMKWPEFSTFLSFV